MTQSSQPSPRPAAPEAGTRWAGEDELADAVVAAVLAVDGVHSMHSGMFGEVATYLPGRRVDGVQIHDSSTELHVVLTWGSDIAATADAIKAAAAPLVGTDIDVTVQDLVDVEDA